MSFTKVYNNCSGSEKCILYGGIMASIITGLCMPVWIMVFGDVIDKFDATQIADIQPE